MVQTLNDVAYLYNEIFKDEQLLTRLDGGHILYRHTGTHHYKQLHKTLPGGRAVRSRAHQIVLLKKINSVSLPVGCEASHLCHIKDCVAEDHITAEPHNINMERFHCADERLCRQDPTFCRGHGQYPRCIGM